MRPALTVSFLMLYKPLRGVLGEVDNTAYRLPCGAGVDPVKPSLRVSPEGSASEVRVRDNDVQPGLD